MNSIYLDYAAATPLDDDVLSCMLPYLKDKFHNPSAVYLSSKSVKQDLEAAREKTAKILGVRPREIIFTAGATEANNLAISGLLTNFPKGKILISAIEHSSVVEPAKKYNHELIPVDNNGYIDLEFLAKQLKDDSVILVSVIYANNEIGTVQHLKKVRQLIDQALLSRKNRGVLHPIYFHSDAAQAPNYLPIQAKKLGLDLMSLNGGKIYGPKQTGVLFVDSKVKLSPIILGGGQEFGIRSGTENVAGFIGFSEALSKTAKIREEESERIKNLKTYFVEELNNKFPNIIITSPENGLYNIVHIQIPGVDNERLMMELDEKGIMCAVGSACSASSDEPSHVLKAIGLKNTEAQSSLRFSMGRQTKKEDIKKVIKTLSDILA